MYTDLVGTSVGAAVGAMVGASVASSTSPSRLSLVGEACTRSRHRSPFGGHGRVGGRGRRGRVRDGSRERDDKNVMLNHLLVNGLRPLCLVHVRFGDVNKVRQEVVVRCSSFGAFPLPNHP